MGVPAAVVLLAIAAANDLCPDGFQQDFDDSIYSNCKDGSGNKLRPPGSIEIGLTTLCAPAMDSHHCCYSAHAENQLVCMTPQIMASRFGLNLCESNITYEHNNNVHVATVNCSALLQSTPAQPADDSGLSTGAIAGIAVGAVAFVGLIAAAAVCL